MKSIYELCYRTNKNMNVNLLFSSHRKAKHYLSKFYTVGMPAIEGSIIIDSYIVKRILF